MHPCDQPAGLAALIKRTPNSNCETAQPGSENYLLATRLDNSMR